MSARESQDRKVIAHEIFAPQVAPADAGAAAGPLRGTTIYSTKHRRDCALVSTLDEFCEAADTSLLPVIRTDAVNLMRVMRQLEDMTRRMRNDRRHESLSR